MSGPNGAADAADAARVLRIAAAVIEDDAGRLLFVRKRGTTAFMQPGGKLEPEESPAETLVRELHEELGLVVELAELRPIGRFAAPAANEAGFSVDAHVFAAPLTGAPEVRAEIEELAWVPADDLGDRDIAPLSRDVLVPLLLAARAAQSAPTRHP